MNRRLASLSVLGLLCACADRGTIDGRWAAPIATETWSALGLQAGEAMGSDVAGGGDLSGDGLADVVITSGLWDAGGAVDAGRALVFLGDATGLTPSAWLPIELQQPSAGMQRAVPVGDIHGDGYGELLVTSAWYDDTMVDEGRAFLLCGSSVGPALCWEYSPGVALATMGGAGFIGDVNGDGYSDIGLAGAGFDHTSGSPAGTGRYLVFHGSPAGMGAQPDWSWSCPEAGCGGDRIAGAGDVNGDGFDDVLLGAELYDGGRTDQGAAWLVLGSASGLPAQPSWTRLGGADFYAAGSDVAAAGDMDGDGYGDVLITSRSATSTISGEGRVELFLGTATGLSAAAADVVFGGIAGGIESARGVGDVNGDGNPDIAVGRDGTASILLGDGAALQQPAAWSDTGSDQYGERVAAAGDVDGDGLAEVLVSQSGLSSGAGGAVLLEVPAAGVSETDASWQVSGQVAARKFGRGGPTGSAGDVNGDGFDDVVVRSIDWPENSGSPYDPGKLHLFLGDADGLSVTEAWGFQGDQNDPSQLDAALGESAVLADFDGDGFADIAASAPLWDDGGDTDTGRVLVFYGSAAGVSATVPDWSVVGADGDTLGQSLAAGDFDCDGYPDLAIGAPLADGGATDLGGVTIYPGGGAGLASATTSLVGAGGGFGAVASGDVNGDGCGDLLVGAPQDSAGAAAEGIVRLYLGGSGGLAGVASWTGQGGQAGANLGFALTAADFNADGFDEIVAAAPEANAEDGLVFVWAGGASGPGALLLTIAGPAGGTGELGSGLDSGGDIDADGYPDLVVGAPYMAGSDDVAQVYCGGDSGLNGVACAEYIGDGELGRTVGIQGDVDGDGRGDLMLNANKQLNASGRVWGYFGGWEHDTVPRTRRPIATQVGSSARILPGNRTDTDGFDLQWVVEPPQGAARVKIQVEAKPVGTPFDGLGLIESASWTNTGPNGALLTETVAGLAGDTHYHWRARLQYDRAQGPFGGAGRWFVGDPASPGGGHLRTFPDSDGDGSPDSVDCSPADPTIFPGAPEVCDGVDQNCDSLLDEAFDADSDGTYDATVPACVTTWGSNAALLDCDDADPTAFPGAAEECDGDLEDCDGAVDSPFDADADGAFSSLFAGCVTAYGAAVDCDDTAAVTYPGATELCDGLDNDCDGQLPPDETDLDGDTVWGCQGDCGPTDGAVAPGLPETCSAIDEDCDGLVAALDPDMDGDGDGVTLCDAVPDCDDADPAIRPGADELCDAVDRDCDGDVDNGWPDLDDDGLADCNDDDADGDGVTAATDCDDADADVLPGGAEVCDGKNNDCDGGVPVDEQDADADGWLVCDGFVEAGVGLSGGGDCDDGDAEISPAATEVCDDVDQDCDGVVDDGLPTSAWFTDLDADGYGDPDAPFPANPHCGPGVGWVEDNQDCDDTRPLVNIEATEIPGNGLDDDCLDGDERAGAILPADRVDAPGIGCSHGGAGSAGGRGLLGLLLVLSRRGRSRRPRRATR